MRRLVCFVLLAMTFVAASRAALPPVQTMMAERSLGSPTAPVTIIEYSSFTCPHCADFHRDTMPRIRAEYIDTGKVRYVLREFPLERRALAATVIARCVPQQSFFGFVDVLYKDQEAWAKSTDPLQALRIRAQLAGLAPADFDACLQNEELVAKIQARAAESEAKDGIRSTPTFVIGARTISGALPYAEFKSAIDEALAAAAKK